MSPTLKSSSSARRRLVTTSNSLRNRSDSCFHAGSRTRFSPEMLRRSPGHCTNSPLPTSTPTPVTSSLRIVGISANLKDEVTGVGVEFAVADFYADTGYFVLEVGGYADDSPVGSSVGVLEG